LIQELLDKVDRFEAFRFESENNADKLNKLYQAGLIDIEGNIRAIEEEQQDM